METLLPLLPVLACGAMMLFICVPMMMKMHKGERQDGGGDRREIDELRDEVARLKAERALDDKRETVDD